MPKFINQRDYDTIVSINKELVNDVVDTPVVLYKLNMDVSETNSYGEASKKEWYSPVQIPCLVKRDKPQSGNELQTVDYNQKWEFHFLRQELIDRQIYPEKGDIIGFDNVYYEVDNTIETQLWGGQTDKKHSIICEAHLSRRTKLQLERPNV